MTKCYLISTTPKCVGVILAWDIFFFMNIAISKYMLHKRALSIKACKCAWRNRCRIICYNKIIQSIIALAKFSHQLSNCRVVLELLINIVKVVYEMTYHKKILNKATYVKQFCSMVKTNYLRFILNGKWHS